MLLSGWPGFILGVNEKVPLNATRVHRWIQIERRYINNDNNNYYCYKLLL